MNLISYVVNGAKQLYNRGQYESQTHLINYHANHVTSLNTAEYMEEAT